MSYAQNLARIRKEKNMSLQDVANASGVSKSMLSKIEREEKNPTLQVAAQIAEGLGTTLSAMLGESEKQVSLLIHPKDRLIFKDDVSGFERHLLSPSFTTKGIEFLYNIIPAKQESAYFPPHRNGVKEYLVVANGEMTVELDDKRFKLEANDALYFEANVKHKFINTSSERCIYYLVIDSYGANE
jgi:transcriptional regulator with XRE-family HTH domain